jgi:hypothetical protein
MTVHTISLASLAQICPAEVEAFKAVAEEERVTIGELLRAVAHQTPGVIDIPDAQEVMEKAEVAFDALAAAFERVTIERDHPLKLEIHDTRNAGIILRVGGTMTLSPSARQIKHLLRCVQADIPESMCDWYAETGSTGT